MAREAALGDSAFWGVGIGTLYEYFRHKQALLLALAERAGHLSDPPLRARVAFGAIGELTARTLYELEDPATQARLARYLLDLAVTVLK